MKNKLIFLAILMVILPVLAFAGMPSQHDKADALLRYENASYMVKSDLSGLHITTFNHNDPAFTCVSLQKVGVNVVSVTNFTKNVKKPEKIGSYITHLC